MTDNELLTIIGIELLRERAMRLDVPRHLADDPAAGIVELQALIAAAHVETLLERDAQGNIVADGGGQAAKRPDLPDRAAWIASRKKAKA